MFWTLFDSGASVLCMSVKFLWQIPINLHPEKLPSSTRLVDSGGNDLNVFGAYDGQFYSVNINASYFFVKLQEYLQPLEELQLNMKNRMEVGAVLRDLRLSNISCKFEAEQLATEQNFKVRYICSFL